MRIFLFFYELESFVLEWRKKMMKRKCLRKLKNLRMCRELNSIQQKKTNENIRFFVDLVPNHRLHHPEWSFLHRQMSNLSSTN